MKSFFYGLTFLIFASCAAEKDYAGMATDLCQCMTPLADLYDRVMVATAQQDSATVASLLERFEELSETGEDCAAKLESKYGDFVGEEEVKAKAAIQEKCPKIAEMMGQATE